MSAEAGRGAGARPAAGPREPGAAEPGAAEPGAGEPGAGEAGARVASGGRRVGRLAWSRVNGFARTRRALAPWIALFGLLAILHLGGAAPSTEAYGTSALVLLPVLAWQVKLVLDAEPDGQRLLANVAVGGPFREVLAGLLAALTPAALTIAVALVFPLVIGAIKNPGSLTGLLFGLWIHVLSALTGLAIGAWSSRAVSPDLGRATLTLVGGVVLVLALGSGAVDPLGWLVPRLTASVKAANDGSLLDVTLLGLHGLAWISLALAGYTRTRLTTRP
ncbi:hypothetical protein [Cryptosporangium phraense]|uniref:Uncharacterized protein n=1 Tax=Cryptosporangium phraense TaxID=2593070 RepID=A0A545B0J2_9ACTN|nr:hypothetical protein [Cryptosporangium phraense]TQS47074.1 hypothetical protein FL583_02090 [Cryptosporangium phraense]